MATKMASQSMNRETVQVYKSVIDDVINNVREAFLDDGAPDEVLDLLKNRWNQKIIATGALEAETRVRHMYYPGGAYKFPTATQNPQTFTSSAAAAAMSLSSQYRLPVQIQPAPTPTPQPYQLAQATSVAKAQPALPPHSQFDGANVVRNESDCIFDDTAIRGSCETQSQQNYCQTGSESTTLASVTQASASSTVEKQPRKFTISLQLDGNGDDSSSSDTDFDIGPHPFGDLPPEEPDEEEEQPKGEEGTPLNSDDDDKTEPTIAETFDTNNCLVSQYEKITRTKNQWKIRLKSGILTVKGKDYVFRQGVGHADW